MPLGGNFFATVQIGPATNTFCYTINTVSLPGWVGEGSGGVKRADCDVHYPPPSSVEVEERVEL